MNLHQEIVIQFGGDRPSLSVWGLAKVAVEARTLLSNLTPNCKPIATRSRYYYREDRKIIDQEIKRLLNEDIIENSSSPWRAQVVVVKSENRKKRFVINYSQTINLFTELDAYPLPRIEELVKTVSQYRIFSILDLRNAYCHGRLSVAVLNHAVWARANKITQQMFDTVDTNVIKQRRFGNTAAQRQQLHNANSVQML